MPKLTGCDRSLLMMQQERRAAAAATTAFPVVTDDRPTTQAPQTAISQPASQMFRSVEQNKAANFLCRISFPR